MASNRSRSARRRRRLVFGFLGAERANVAMIFALAVIPLMITAGSAVDLSRALWVRARLSQALDAAGLAVGATLGLDDSATQQLAQKYFDANYPSSDLGTPSPLSVTVNGNVIDLSASAALDTTLMRLVGIDVLNVSASSEITRSSKNLEIAVALDTTGSMCSPDSQPCPSGSDPNYANTRIGELQVAADQLIDLVVQDTQTPTYSKMAIVPWSMAVNVGDYADEVRGPVTPGTDITNATWAAGSAKTITGATRASPVVITSAGHGFSNGDRVYIKSVNGMTQINNKQFTVTNATANTFALQGINGSSYNNYSSGGSVTKCLMSDCSVVVTSSGHGLSNGDHVYISGVGGMTQINNKTFTAANVTSNTFDLSGVTGTSYGTYTSGGTAYCTTLGCEYLYFQSGTGSWNTFPVSTCVSERTGADAYTDAPPSTTYFGYNYTSSNNPCIGQTIVPLTSDKTALHNAVAGLTAEGSTGGQIGTAWAWYTISPNFDYLFPSESQPGAYNDPNILKVVVLMTDGLYNTVYCNGTISEDSTSGSGSNSDHANCSAPNGDSYSQARSQCDGMKAQGIIVYAVGFDIASDANAQAVMNYCAQDASHVYLPNSGADLAAAFVSIAQDVTALRISK